MPSRRVPPTRAPDLTESAASPAAAGRGFTIGQAAAFAGVAVETVRRYHQDGLLDEPEPDDDGSRRYRSADTLQLVRVRALAGAGVTRNEIRALLDYLDHVEHLLGISRSSRL
ncbi:MerR family transcriptional regulator [Nocardia vaccinii]|uniref:MerR family transcriptional regulator n=1 Tax=Nocardia vaccinii TaxID=1822 RepID=UPI0008316EE2|nr:MerR family transcriptional regulator [Nocardia vaccinii]